MKNVNGYTGKQVNRGHVYLFTCLLVYLGACSPKVEPSQLRIAISPAAQPASAGVLACLPRDESVTATIDAVYPAEIDLSNFDLYIRLGEPNDEEGFAAQIAIERIVAAFQPGSHLATLSLSALADLFAGRNGQEAALWVGPDSDEARRAYEELGLHGAVSGAALVAAEPQAVLDAVAADPDAAGLLPAAWTEDTVRTIDLGIGLPVLVVAEREPSGAARALVACLQGATGQAELAKTYTPLP